MPDVIHFMSSLMGYLLTTQPPLKKTIYCDEDKSQAFVSGMIKVLENIMLILCALIF